MGDCKDCKELRDEVVSLRESVNAQASKIVHQGELIEKMTEFMTSHQATMDNMVEAWEAIGWFGRAIKWVASIAASIAAIWAAIAHWRPH